MSETNRKILVLLDAHAILHRAFHALPDFTSPYGEPTGALYGFTAFLIKVIRELKPDYIAAAYDLPKPTFRHIAYDKYKAGRAKMDDRLANQINRSHDILKAFNVPVYSAEGFEADDVLGTIVENLKSQISNLKIIVASGDMDTLQLVKSDNVVVYTLKKGISDTIIYDEKIEAKPRVIELLKRGEEEAQFSKTLAEIRRDAPIDFSLEKISWKDNFDKEKVRPILSELGFKSLIDRLSGENKKNGEAKKETVKEIKTGTIVSEILMEMVEKPLVKILAEMENRGALIDMKYLKKLSEEKHKELESLEKKIWKLAGEEFNISSPKQLGEILFVKLGLGGTRPKMTATGAYSTNIAQLIKLKETHPIIGDIMEHREISKLVSTYIDTLPKLADEKNRLHT